MNDRRRSALKYAAAASASLLLGACERKAPPQAADKPFAAGALRLDLRHSIRDGADAFQIERIRAEPRWGTRTANLASPPDWGDFRLSVSDAEGALLARSGFDSPLAPGAHAATTDLSLRFPMPARLVRVVVEKRRAGNTFAEMLDAAVDPASSAIDRSASQVAPRVDALLANGDPAEKVDLAIVGDGYTGTEHEKFLADARRAMGYLFAVRPFTARMREINVNAVFVASGQSGVTDGFMGIEKNTALRCAYGAGENERTLSVGDHRALCEAASAVPCDFVLVLANSRRYGGSAYFGGPAVVAIDSPAADYLVVHELAHVIGGLAEEYYIPTADGPSYRGNVEPWNPNVTLSGANAKWRDASGATPTKREWNRAEYEKRFSAYVKRYVALRAQHRPETEIEKLMRFERDRLSALLAKNGDPSRIGLFEGANGYARGVYRSEADCIMFSLQAQRFCTACAAALERAILYCASGR